MNNQFDYATMVEAFYISMDPTQLSSAILFQTNSSVGSSGMVIWAILVAYKTTFKLKEIWKIEVYQDRKTPKR